MNSPKYSNYLYPCNVAQNFKSPPISPQKNSPNFSPNNYSSPIKGNCKKYRYFSSSLSNSSNNSYGSPSFSKQSKKHFHQRKSFDHSFNKIDPSIMENPWAELEKEWEERKSKSTDSKLNIKKEHM